MAYKTEDYTTQSGKIFPMASKEDVAAVLGKAFGVEVGSLIVLRNGGVLLCPPKAPAKPVPKISEGPANEGVSAAQMMAQMAEMMRQFQAMQAGAGTAPKPLTLPDAVKGRGHLGRKRAAG